MAFRINSQIFHALPYHTRTVFKTHTQKGARYPRGHVTPLASHHLKNIRGPSSGEIMRHCHAPGNQTFVQNKVTITLNMGQQFICFITGAYSNSSVDDFTTR